MIEKESRHHSHHNNKQTFEDLAMVWNKARKTAAAGIRDLQDTMTHTNNILLDQFVKHTYKTSEEEYRKELREKARQQLLD